MNLCKITLRFRSSNTWIRICFDLYPTLKFRFKLRVNMLLHFDLAGIWIISECVWVRRERHSPHKRVCIKIPSFLKISRRHLIIKRVETMRVIVILMIWIAWRDFFDFWIMIEIIFDLIFNFDWYNLFLLRLIFIFRPFICTLINRWIFLF